MKSKIILIAAFAAALTALFSACGGGGRGESANGPADSSSSAGARTGGGGGVKVYRTKGVVKSVDAKGSKITIDHDEIPGFMSPMVMTDDVRDPKLLEGVAAGDTVDLEVETSPTGGGGGATSSLVITKIVRTGTSQATPTAAAAGGGGELFKANCAECHGASGEGAPKGISLLEGHALKHGEDEFIARVTNGKAGKMPPFREKLTPEQIAAVVKYVREELQKGRSEPDAAGHKH